MNKQKRHEAYASLPASCLRPWLLLHLQIPTPASLHIQDHAYPIVTATPTPVGNSPVPLSFPLRHLLLDPIFSTFLSPDFNPTQFSSAALSSGSAASRIEKLQEGSASSIRNYAMRSSPAITTSSTNSPPSRLLSPPSLPSALLFHHYSPPSAEPELSSPIPIASLPPRPTNSTIFTPLPYYFNVVDTELKWVTEIGSKIREEGMKVLEKGLESLNQPEVGLGLQVFYNMGELRGTVDGLVSKYKQIAVKSVSNALDMKAISGGGYGGGGPGGVQRHGTPQIGAGAKAREALWQRMSGCMDQLHSNLLAVWHLQSISFVRIVMYLPNYIVQSRASQALSIPSLHKTLEGDQMLTDRVWDAFVKSFASQMKSVFTASSFVKEIFTIGYPKLFTMVENLLERISRDTDVKGVPPALTSEGKEQMIAAIETFQTAFLALCLSRLSDLVNSVFPMSSRGSVPSKEHISRITSRIQEEIEAVQQDARLTLLVLREINKVLLLLAERAEYQISTGPEARQITGHATPAQLKNFTLCQHLQEVHKRVTSILAGLPTVAADVLSPALGTIYGVAGDSVTSLFQAMLDRLESCILQIHDQNFGSAAMDAAMDNNASPYMEELQKSIIHFRAEFLSRLLPSSGASSAKTETICTRLVRSMASRVLIFFIRHASLVRPLSESGKLRMARDMAELELAVAQNLFPVEQLGPPYRALRAFRPVIFLETSQLGSSPLLQDLPPSVILHHLYSRGPEDLQSPLQRNKLTPLQYSLWMDSQGEDQIWKGIKATLDDYAAKVRARGDKEFSPVYPLMMKIGASLTENES
ncbi:UNVERIFIED_CONTAM: Conserved oligomeric Golgi complex subunit [Sesamum radiatum]|uniref:Conserved oligomeric Golgi complex subunit n=1 Tax=Sesamum radiatum TaxID=300843 RepID=A0AAW2LMG8_SESRA